MLINLHCRHTVSPVCGMFVSYCWLDRNWPFSVIRPILVVNYLIPLCPILHYQNTSSLESLLWKVRYFILAFQWWCVRVRACVCVGVCMPVPDIPLDDSEHFLNHATSVLTDKNGLASSTSWLHLIWYVCSLFTDGEHHFVDTDTKLHKVAPAHWKDGNRGRTPMVTFTLFFRVKFYVDNINYLR